MRHGHYQDGEEGKRGVSLSLTNAVFSKLIKMGRQLGKTPQRMAQELFDEAYVARCTGKVVVPGEGGVMASAIEEDLRQQLTEARAKHRNTLSAYDAAVKDGARLKEKLDKLHTDIREAAYEAWPAAEDVGEDAGHIIREIAGERDQAEMNLLKAREEIQDLREAAKGQLVVVNQASEILKREAMPPEEPAWAQPPSASQLRAIRAMKAAGNSPSAIARQLAVSIETIKAALA